MADKYSKRREKMVQEQLSGRGIEDTAVLQAMRQVPREIFVLKKFIEHAYDDTPLPIPAGQTISQPYVVAFMIAALRLASTDKVLEIGTGSGYAAAILSRVAAEVITVERHDTLGAFAQKRFAELNYDNIAVHAGDGTLGWPPAAPYEGIVVAAAGPFVPPALKEQLAVNGRLVMPIGNRTSQDLIRLVRQGEDRYSRDNLGPVKFVPLIGEDGWEM